MSAPPWVGKLCEDIRANRLPQRRFLRLVYKRLEPIAVHHLAEALASNSTITTLHLEHNTLGDEGAKAIASLLRVNTTIRHVDLSANRIGDEGAVALADALTSNTAVEDLRLLACLFTDDAAAKFGEMLKRNDTLTSLSLGSVRLRCASLFALLQAICLPGLTSPRGIQHLADGLKQNVGLAALHLPRQPVLGEGVVALADALRVNSSLQHLGLDGCGIDASGGTAILQALAENDESALRSITLRDNPLPPSMVVQIEALLRDRLNRLAAAVATVDDVLLRSTRNSVLKHTAAAMSPRYTARGMSAAAILSLDHRQLMQLVKKTEMEMANTAARLKSERVRRKLQQLSGEEQRETSKEESGRPRRESLNPMEVSTNDTEDDEESESTASANGEQRENGGPLEHDVDIMAKELEELKQQQEKIMKEYQKKKIRLAALQGATDNAAADEQADDAKVESRARRETMPEISTSVRSSERTIIKGQKSPSRTPRTPQTSSRSKRYNSDSTDDDTSIPSLRSPKGQQIRSSMVKTEKLEMSANPNESPITPKSAHKTEEKLFETPQPRKSSEARRKLPFGKTGTKTKITPDTSPSITPRSATATPSEPAEG